jgi:HAD superfamily hydrolase (TIGR01662 family)
MKFKGIIFDLDQTLVDSSRLETLRGNKQWNRVLKSLNQIKIDYKIQNLLNTLSHSDIKIGIITNSPRNYAEAVLQQFEMPFNLLIAYHDVLKRKPHPESFSKALHEMNLAKYEVLSVGDQDNDIMASKHADICAVGAKWYTPNYTFTVPPNYICYKVDELIQLLK